MMPNQSRDWASTISLVDIEPAYRNTATSARLMATS